MQRFEYRVVPAPRRGIKGKGIRGTEAQFAHALSLVMNEAAAEGWEYQRTDSLPCEERQGLTGRTTVFQNMLVFRRAIEAEQAVAPQEPAALPAPEAQDSPPPAQPEAAARPPAPVTPLTLSVDAPEGAAPSIGVPDPRVAQTLTRDRSVAAE